MTNLRYTPEEPIAAIATALSPGAIGIVRTSGKGAVELLSKIFSRPEALTNASPNSLVYGWICDGEKKIDQVMVGVYRAPKSFTGEDMAEIFCHGGVAVVTAVHNLLLKSGFRQAERGEFTFRAFVNGKTDLTRAEAVKEIIDSKTDTSRSRAAGRLAGTLYSEIDSIKKLIVDTLAAIEVEIEYPEDEETIANSFDSTNLHIAAERLGTLVSSWKSEKLYQDGAKVVLCGKTNAGKSSLFNALLKEDRAIVSDVEGTTRDWLESWASFDGIPVRLFDTAGLRETDDIVEAAGVERTKDLSEDADLLLYVVDSRKGLEDDDKDFFSKKHSAPLIVAWNKCDAENSLPCPEKGDWAAAIPVSAKQGIGVGDLCRAAKAFLTEGSGSENTAAGLGSARQKKSVAEALERVTHAISAADSGFALDAVVQDLEDSLDSLGEVTGEVTADDVLESIFSNFCVGK